jgi:hypothetical protein
LKKICFDFPLILFHSFNKLELEERAYNTKMCRKMQRTQIEERERRKGERGKRGKRERDRERPKEALGEA